MSTHGACLCGGVGFDVGLPTLWVAHCHCTLCQRHHGAGVVTWVGVDEARFTLRDPGGLLRWYDSSPHAQRGFCAHCGSSLFFRGEKWPGEVHIARASFLGPLLHEPQAHVFYNAHVPWLPLADNLPRYGETAT